MALFEILMEEHISGIINGIFAIIGVIIGAIITYLLDTLGSINIFLNIKTKVYDKDTISGVIKPNPVPYNQADRLWIVFEIDLFNSSGTSKALRLIEISNGNDLHNIRYLSSTYNVVPKTLKVINLNPKEMKNIECDVHLNKDFFRKSEKTKLYFTYKIGKSNRKHKLLLTTLSTE